MRLYYEEGNRMNTKTMTRSEWVLSQLCTKHNIIGALGIFSVLMYTILYGSNKVGIAMFFVAYFLITSWQMIATMIVVSVIVTAICAVLPFLAPVAFVIMLILFFARIGYVLKNWRAVISGLLVYGLAILLVVKQEYVYIAENKFYTAILYVAGKLPDGIWAIFSKPGIFVSAFTVALFVTGITFFYQMLLYWQYRNGYTASVALNIMGSIPLVIIALILPFLKAAPVDGGGVDGVSGDFAHDGGFAHEGGVHDGMVHDGAVHDGMVHDGAMHDGVRPPTGYHHVNGYMRTAPDGHTEYVHDYIRSNPDGILENNLSYNGHGTHSYTTEGSYELPADAVVHEQSFFAKIASVMDVSALSKTARSAFSPQRHTFSAVALVYLGVCMLSGTVIYIVYR